VGQNGLHRYNKEVSKGLRVRNSLCLIKPSFLIFFSPRIWSIYIIFFLFNLVVASVLAFLLGRLVNIDVQMVVCKYLYCHLFASDVYNSTSTGNTTRSQSTAPYHKKTFGSQRILVLISRFVPLFEIGLSSYKIINPNQSFALQWTLSPFTKNDGSAPVISFNHSDSGDKLYFSEITFPELKVGGSGAGTFNMTPVRASVKEQKTDHSPTTGRKAHSLDVMDSGSIVRYPRWGIRIHCEKIPEPSVNM